MIPRALAVVGPTASGKARFGAEVSARLEQPVLVCDSVKVYRHLDVGSAKPPPELRARVPHLLIDLVEPDEPFSAGDYAREAWSLFPRTGGVFVGGTGFYLRTVAVTASGGGEAGRPVDDEERVQFEQRWREAEKEESGAVHRALTAQDPATGAAIHPNNVARALRALWLCELHGTALSRVRSEDPPRERLQLLSLVLDPGVEIVDRQIERRVDAMLANGWLSEVEKLLSAGYHGRLKSMQTLGYKQLAAVAAGRTELSAARDEIVAATRKYARRQRAFFRTQLPGGQLVLRRPEDCPWDRVDAFLAGGTK